ncbi:MAG: 2'-5' RNA ligase family protein [Acidobacteria bacterium]|nr:2'-5' RNA ligase family protein [Acidobacteriota bacterium]
MPAVSFDDLPPVVAIDVALLPPPGIVALAERLNALARSGDDLTLDADHLPHLTIVQQFIRRERLDEACAQVEDVWRTTSPFTVRLESRTKSSGSPHSSLLSPHSPVPATIVLEVEPSPDLRRLHELMLEALAGYAHLAGTADAFAAGEEPRLQDVEYVKVFHTMSAGGRFSPHITLGHGEHEFLASGPLDFPADHLALCQLGRFCTCGVVLREWRQ